MTETHAHSRTTHPKSSRRRSTDNGGFLQSDQRGQGHRQKQRFARSSTILWAIILGCVVLFRLIAETGLVRNLSFLTMNEQLHSGREYENSSPTLANHTAVVSASGCDENDEYFRSETCSNMTTLRNRSSMRETTNVFSGSTFQSVPSATNLLLSPRTRQRQQQHHNCYETSAGHVFHEKSNEDYDYSDTNYVLHVLGGGTCHQDGFGSFPGHASKNIIVTAYYEIPSKHPPHKYHEWMANFLSVYRDPMVIFTSPNLVGFLANLRHNNYTEPCEKPCGPPSLYFDTIIVALPLEELPLAKIYPQSFWYDQLDRDPQSAIHSPLRGDPRMQGKFESGELYWIWLSKAWFVTEATRILGANTKQPEDPRDPSRGSGGYSNSNTTTSNNTYDQDVFAWIDIGSFRNEDPTAKNKNPSPLLLRHPEVVPPKEMLFWSHSSAHSSPSSNSIRNIDPAKNYAPIPPRESPYFDDKSLGGGRYFFHSGAHFVGRPRSILRFYRRFLQTIDVFVERNLTLADDQAVMQSVCLSYYESHEDDDHIENGGDKHPANLCAYATRTMIGGKSKWFGLTKLLQTGWAETNHSARSVDRSGNPSDLYWRPPPPGYYLEYENRSVDSPFNSSASSSNS